MKFPTFMSSKSVFEKKIYTHPAKKLTWQWNYSPFEDVGILLNIGVFQLVMLLFCASPWNLRAQGWVKTSTKKPTSYWITTFIASWTRKWVIYIAGMFGRARNFHVNWNLMLVDGWNSAVELLCSGLKTLSDPFFDYMFLRLPTHWEKGDLTTRLRLEDFTPPSIEARYHCQDTVAG